MNAETNVFLYRWSTDVYIDRQHCLTVLYCAKIIKNKDVNNLGTNTLYTNYFNKFMVPLTVGRRQKWVFPKHPEELGTHDTSFLLRVVNISREEKAWFTYRQCDQIGHF